MEGIQLYYRHNGDFRIGPWGGWGFGAPFIGGLILGGIGASLLGGPGGYGGFGGYPFYGYPYSYYNYPVFY